MEDGMRMDWEDYFHIDCCRGEMDPVSYWHQLFQLWVMEVLEPQSSYCVTRRTQPMDAPAWVWISNSF